MTQLALLLDATPRRPRRMVDTSLANFDRIRVTLMAREATVLLALQDAIDRTGYPDFTGGELADVSGLSILVVRPRLTGLYDKGLLWCVPKRASRARWECDSHAWKPSVSREAIAHWRSEQLAKEPR